jgi:choline dehydrogenase-like flavoprotein
MGNDAEAVVDHDMKVWNVENLWVSSTGVLPSAGTANPTFSMLCLTHALAKKLHTVD